jgi:ABC-type phosphate transport system substrate-binding protein
LKIVYIGKKDILNLRLLVLNEQSFALKFERRIKNLKKSKAIVCVFLVTFLAISAFSAVPVQAQTDLVSPGQLKVYGSSTIYPVSAAAVPDFQAYVATLPSPFTSTTVTLNALGSGSGFTAIAKNNPPTADIAASSEAGIQHTGFYGATYPTTNCYLLDPQEFKVGDDSIAIMVPDTITWLTQASASQVADIFRTTANGNEVPLYTTWGDWASAQSPPVTLSPTDAAQTIGRIGRVYSSGTFDGFNSYFLQPFGYNMKYSASSGQTAGDWLPGNYQDLTSNAEVMTAIQQPANAYAIAFIGLGFVQQDIGGSGPNNIVPINLYNPTTGQYVSPSLNNVIAGLYVNNAPTGPKAILRPLMYFMDGIPSANDAAAVKSLWISFVKSNPTYISAEGYVPMNRADFAGTPSGNPSTTAGTQTLPDGKVDFNDLLYFSGVWTAYNGPNKILNPYGDFNADGKIDFNDLLGFSGAWTAYNS